MAGEISTKSVSIEVSEGDTITVKIPADGGMPSVHKNKFRYHYGPTSTDPDAGKMWHYDCGGEVYGFEEGLICSKCGQSEG